jgi:hypothetical protein
MDDPNNIKVVKNPSINYALTGVIAYRATEGNLPRLMEFIKRLPVEFQVITIRTMMQKNKDFEMHPTVLGWISDNSHHFM